MLTILLNHIYIHTYINIHIYVHVYICIIDTHLCVEEFQWVYAPTSFMYAYLYREREGENQWERETEHAHSKEIARACKKKKEPSRTRRPGHTVALLTALPHTNPMYDK